MNNVIFTVPKKQCKEIEIRGVPFVQIDMGMDADTFLINYLKWQSSGDATGVVVKKEVEHE